MDSPFTTSKLDFLGITASLLCAVHCMVVPILFSLTAWSRLVYFHDPVIERAVLSASAVIAVVSLSPSYFRRHRKLKAIYIVMAGFALAGTGKLLYNETAELVLTSAGALLIALAHYTNWKLCRHCKK